MLPTGVSAVVAAAAVGAVTTIGATPAKASSMAVPTTAESDRLTKLE